MRCESRAKSAEADLNVVDYNPLANAEAKEKSKQQNEERKTTRKKEGPNR